MLALLLVILVLAGATTGAWWVALVLAGVWILRSIGQVLEGIQI